MAEVAHELLLQNMFLLLLNLFRVLVAMKMLATYLKRSETRYACTVALKNTIKYHNNSCKSWTNYDKLYNQNYKGF